jgi:acetyl/propionyl-CoA carboxylase alpha subunit
VVAFDGRTSSIECDGRHVEGLVVRDGDVRWLGLAAGDVRLRRVAAVASGADETAADGALRAPMPGRVIEVAVTLGERVARGALLLKLEAMKMEHRVLAERDGRVADLPVTVGDQVAAGALLVVVETVDEEMAP